MKAKLKSDFVKEKEKRGEEGEKKEERRGGGRRSKFKMFH